MNPADWNCTPDSTNIADPVNTAKKRAHGDTKVVIIGEVVWNTGLDGGRTTFSGSCIL